jgi:long-chain fatty acid transport protein
MELMNRLGPIALFTAAFLFLAPSAQAAGSEIPDQSASASGTAGASTARASDPAAAFFNPAALVDGRGLRVGVGSAFAVAALRSESAPGAPGAAFAIDAQGSLRAIPHLAASYAYRDFALGLSLHVPFGGAVAWPASSALRFEALESSQRVVRIAPFVGARFKMVSVAAGPQIDLGQVEVKRATNHVLEEGSAHLLLDGSGIGAQAAVFVEPTDRLAFGLSYKSRSMVRLTGDGDFTVPAVFASRYPDQAVSARLYLPDRIALGAAYAITPPARVLFDVTYTVWSQNQSLVFDFAEPQTPDTTIKNEWRDTMAFRLGGELDVVPRVTARAGAFVDGLPTPAAPSNNLTPASPDMSRVGGSAGAGVKVTSGVAVDAFYSLFTLLERSSTSNNAPLATYSGTAHIFGLGARFVTDFGQGQAAPPVLAASR